MQINGKYFVFINWKNNIYIYTVQEIYRFNIISIKIPMAFFTEI